MSHFYNNNTNSLVLWCIIRKLINFLLSCWWRRSIVTDHHFLPLSMRKWPGSNRVQKSPKITMRHRHIWRKSTFLCMLTPASDNHKTITMPALDSWPSELDMTSCTELMVHRTYRKTHQLCCKNMIPALQSNTKHMLLWCWLSGLEIKMISFRGANAKKPKIIKWCICNSQEKKCYFINIWKKLHSSWKHLFRCMSFNNHILWGERDIQREKKQNITSHWLLIKSQYRHFT